MAHLILFLSRYLAPPVLILPLCQVPGPSCPTRPAFSRGASREELQPHHKQVYSKHARERVTMRQNFPAHVGCHAPSSLELTRAWVFSKRDLRKRACSRTRFVTVSLQKDALRLLGAPQVIVFSSDNGGVPYAGALNYPFRGSKVRVT